MRFSFVLLTLFVFITIITSAQTCTLVPYRSKNLWGYASLDGKIVIQPQYDSVTLFKHPGVNGWKDADPVHAYVYKNRLTGIIDSTGKAFIPVIWDSIAPIQLEETGRHNAVLVRGKNKKYGVVSYKNKVVIPVEYDALDVYFTTTDDYHLTITGYRFAAKKGNYFYDISLDGKRKERITEQQYLQRESQDIAYAMDEVPSSSNVGDIYRNRALFVAQNKDLIDSISNRTFGHSDEFLEVFYKGKAGLVRQSELFKVNIKDFIKPEYDAIIEEDSKWYGGVDAFLVKKDGYVSVIDKEGRLLMPFKYKDHGYWNSVYILTREGNKMGFYRFKDNLDITPKYDALELLWFSNVLLFKVKVDGKLGYIDEKEQHFWED